MDPDCKRGRDDCRWQHRGAGRRGQFEEELGELRCDLRRSVLSDEHRDGGEALRAGRQYAEIGGFERVYDLYCGIGTIGLLMAPRAAELWGLETDRGRDRRRHRNALRNEIDNVTSLPATSGLLCENWWSSAGRPDVLVVDPPRAGLSQKIVRRIIEAGPKRIVYVSCNPTTLAPTWPNWSRRGYRVSKVGPWTCSRRRRTWNASHSSCAAPSARVRLPTCVPTIGRRDIVEQRPDPCRAPARFWCGSTPPASTAPTSPAGGGYPAPPGVPRTFRAWSLPVRWSALGDGATRF